MRNFDVLRRCLLCFLIYGFNLLYLCVQMDFYEKYEIKVLKKQGKHRRNDGDFLFRIIVMKAQEIEFVVLIYWCV